MDIFFNYLQIQEYLTFPLHYLKLVNFANKMFAKLYNKKYYSHNNEQIYLRKIIKKALLRYK